MTYCVRENAIVELQIYPQSKFTYQGDECTRRKWSGKDIATWEVVEGNEAYDLCNALRMQQTMELLVIRFEDGHTEVYDNAKCDMFVM